MAFLYPLDSDRYARTAQPYRYVPVLARPTDHPFELAKAVSYLTPYLFPPDLPGVRYARLGVILLDLQPKGELMIVHA